MSELTRTSIEDQLAYCRLHLDNPCLPADQRRTLRNQAYQCQIWLVMLDQYRDAIIGIRQNPEDSREAELCRESAAIWSGLLGDEGVRPDSLTAINEHAVRCGLLPATADEVPA